MLAVLFLIAPFYYHPNIGGEGLRIPNNITVWMMATVIIAYSLHLVLKRPTFVLPKYFIYIAAFPILITLSGFVTGVEQPMTWLFRLLFIWGGLAFFFSLFQHGLKQGRLDRILFIIVISALLQGLVGIAQIWLKADMPFWLPKSPNGVPSGLFQQINNQASYQVTAIMIAGYLITRPFLTQGSKWQQVVLIITVACATFLIAVSGSRIGALTLVLGLLIIIPALWQRFKCNKKIAWALCLALVFGGTLGLTTDDNKIIDKTLALQSGYSGNARLGIYTIALDLINQQPLFGHGVGSFGRVFQYARPDFYKAHPDAVLPEDYVSHPHNEILFWLVESGLVAGVSLLVVLLGVILMLKQIGWQRGGAYAAMLLPIFLHTEVELPLYVSVNMFFLILLLMMGMMRHTKHKEKVLKPTSKSLLCFTFYPFLFCIQLFFFHTAKANFDITTYYESSDLKKLTYLKEPILNPYFRDQAIWFLMGDKLYLNMDLNNNFEVEKFVRWATQSIILEPHSATYIRLVDAYFFLGDVKQGCLFMLQAEHIYPTYNLLTEIASKCNST